MGPPALLHARCVFDFELSDLLTGSLLFEQPKGSGVLLTVTHRRLPDRSTMLKVSAGWHMHLDILVARASDKEPAPFWDGWARLQQEYDRRLPA